MSMTDRVVAAGDGARGRAGGGGRALASMSLPLRGRRMGPSGASSWSGVKTLLPLLVLGDGSVGLKLTGERRPCTCARRARGNVFLPGGTRMEAKAAGVRVSQVTTDKRR